MSDPRGAPLAVAVDATPLLGPRTGVGVFCAGALAALGARDDLDVRAFAVSWRRRDGLIPLLAPGVRAHQRAMPARPLHLLWRRGRLPPVEWFVGDVDVVHGTNYVVPPTRRAARVVTVHDLTAWRYPQLTNAASLAFPEFVRRAIDGGAWVHTHTRFVADEVVGDLGADPERVRAVAPGIPGAPDGDRTTPAPETHERAPTAEEHGPPALALGPGLHRYVLAVGTIEPRKDYPGLVRAFDQIAGDHDDLALVVVGAPGWGASAFEVALDAARWRERVVRPGFLSDAQLVSVMARAAVLAYPSVYEGFGFPPLQAMAAGVPVVATAAGSVPEVVGDGALLVPPGDADALAGALAGVLDDGDRRRDLVARGRTQAAQYTWDRCGAGLAALYAAAAR